MTSHWTHRVRFAEVREGAAPLVLEPTAEQRAAIARDLGLVELPELAAKVRIHPWFDGMEVQASWRARVIQTCGVSLEPFETGLSGQFAVRVVPAGSLHAPGEEDLAEIDLEAEDPPDVSETGEVDLAALVYEHLALEIDPFPRAPGAVFAPPEPSEEISPFAALSQLKKEP